MSKGNRTEKGQKAQRWLAEQSPFPKKLRRLMEKNGTTQQQLADVIGVTRQTISQYTGGLTVPDIYTVQQIADYFGVKVGYLLSEEELTLFYNLGDFKETCTTFAGKEMCDLFFRILSLTEAGRDKVADRVEELMEIPRYHISYQEYLADIQCKGE